MGKIDFETLVALNDIEIFGSLEPSEIESIAKAGEVVKYRPGEMILSPEETSNDLFCILHGEVRVFNYSLSGKEVDYDDLQEGGVFGELATLDSQSRSAHVIAIKPLEVFKVTQAEFLKILQTYPEVSIGLCRHLAHIVRTTSKRLLIVSTSNSRLRLMSVLLEVCELRDDKSAAIPRAATHKMLSSRVGCTRETTTRMLLNLQSEGLIERNEQNQLFISDIRALEEAIHAR